MLTKEKCKKAINNVARYCSDYKYCMIPLRFELINELDVLMSLIQEHFELVELLKPHGYGMLSAEEFEHWISYICKHNADNDMIIMSQNEQLEQIKNPQPYKFEDLKVGIWVYDDKQQFEDFRFIKIDKILSEFDCEHLYHDKNKKVFFDNISCHAREFEENRFYPVTKALEYQK